MSETVATPTALGPAGDPAPGRLAGYFDECFDQEGKPRKHWQGLLASLARLGDRELGERAESVRRILAENGVNCFVARGNGGADEPWRLDVIPLVIGCAEWRSLEAGLVQRARLLNLILRDLYGTQHLLRNGLVPAVMVYANPGYLRPCQAIGVGAGAYIDIYAADLGRSPDGRWWILADRTQAPTGLGFAMENRSVLSRVLPEATRDVRPRSVLDAVRVASEAARGSALQTASGPRITLLTPGPRDPAYFEHTYLSRLLGSTLVEGDDLTVRGGQLFIKTLDGLLRTEVVVRRVEDALCDPLELRSDSVIGVAGLVQAARAGCVRVGNALGAGLLESPAFMPFLPGLCRHLLGEDLRLPALATWWCGQARENAFVREHLDRLAVRPAFSLDGRGVTPTEMTDKQRAALMEELRSRPSELVGQEQIQLSRAPGWTATEGHVCQPFVLRAFVLWDGNEFVAVPGGLAHVLDQDLVCSSAFPLNGTTKDVWVLQELPAACEHVTLASVPAPALDRAPSDLPSRTADNFFWLGRYAERLEQLVRAARHVVRCLEDGSIAASARNLAPLEQSLARLGLISKGAAANASGDRLQTDVLRSLFEEDQPGGVPDLLERMRLSAFSIRDRLSADTWRILNRLQPDARRRSGGLSLVQASGVLHALTLDLAAFSGMEMENMTRSYAWSFLDIGRRIERGMFVGRFMREVLTVGGGIDLLLESALEIADSAITHRRRYLCEPRIASVTEVLVEDPSNPRSLAFQVLALKSHSEALPAGANPAGLARLRKQLDNLEEQLRSLLDGLRLQQGLNTMHTAALLDRLVRGLADFSELLTQVYFSHVTPQVS